MKLFFLCSVLCVAVTILPAVSGITIPSSYCTASYTRKKLVYTQYCRTCGWWWWRHTCCYRRCSYTTEVVTYRKCCTGYKGTQCNIPICSPPCQNKGVCVAVNKCDCPNAFTGGSCQTRRCSYATDCYPGICRGSAHCVCSSEFDGNNCQTMKEGPIFQECVATLYDKSGPSVRTLENTNCTFLGETVKIYTKHRDFTHIGLEWKPSYRKLGDLPTYPSEGYLRTFRVGVIDAWGEIVLKDNGGATINTDRVTCLNSGTWTNPQETIVCDTDNQFTRGIRHRQEIDVKMYGLTGGFKDVRNQDTAGSYVNRRFTGRTGSLKATFLFDLEPPVHCKENSSCEVEGIEPIVIDEDITKTPKVTLTFTGWNDADSGLRGFKYYVYELAATEEGILQNFTEPEITQGYDLFEETANATFTLSKPGMYSILGEIMDFADNKRYARAFVLYDDGSHGIEETSEPIRVTPGPDDEQIEKAYWLDDLNSPVTISWANRYKNSFLTENKYDAEIASLHHPNLLDFTYGNISAGGTPSLGGITAFSYAVVHRVQQETRKRRSIDPPDKSLFTPVPAGQSQVILPLIRNNGDGYTFWIKARDQLRNEVDNYIYIRADNTPPTIVASSLKFNKNVEREKKGFYSSIEIVTTDLEGGIHKIDFAVYDVIGDPVLIREGSQAGQKSQEDKSMCSTTGKCTCTNLGECYSNPQIVYLNNCWFLQYMNVPARFEATVTNRARLSTNTSLDLGDITGLSGIGEYPPADGFRLKDAFGYSVVLTWYLPVSCYDIRTINIDLTGGNGGRAQLSAGETETELKDLVPYADYTANLYIVYQGRRESTRNTIEFNTGKPPQPVGFATGAIAGIVVGILVLLALIVTGILVGIRVKQHKTPVPRRIMTIRNNIANRFSRRFHDGGSDNIQDKRWDDDLGAAPPPYPGVVEGHVNRMDSMTLNVAYTSGPKLRDFEEDLYTYGELQTDPSATWKHSDDKVTVGKTIHSGRFAEIKEGTLRDRQGHRKVALKMVKHHNSDNDLLMKAKMNFYATVVENHNNIVNFVGAITEGPILLLELCDQSLKDWLKNVEKVTDDVEDNMINFATDISRGMQHLHENEIIHRRLGARNVLLKNIPLMGRLVAKVTGFGPMKGETSGDAVNSEKERIPIKWMALEQLGIEQGQKRPYTQKTDIWSYGVTMWEIFSKGETPFAKNRSGDIRGMLERGIRLECPTHCDESLYDDLMRTCWQRDPDARPSFDDITGSLERLFHGAPDGDEYYDDKPGSLDKIELYDGTLPTH